MLFSPIRHRGRLYSLRSLCVVLTINQPLRGCAAVIAAVVLARIFTEIVWRFLTRILIELSPDYHSIVFVRAIFVKNCVYYCRTAA